jgi:hypothetical protein
MLSLILTFFNPKRLIILCIVIVAAIALTYGYNVIYDRGAQSVQVKWNATEEERTKEIDRIKLETERKNVEIVTKAAAQQKALNEKIVNLNKSLTTALASLSDRPDRPSGETPIDSTGTESATSCTGTNLFRQDAEFLIREAARADEIRLYWAQCQEQYNFLKDTINKQ